DGPDHRPHGGLAGELRRRRLRQGDHERRRPQDQRARGQGATLFKAQHEDHAKAFNAAATQLGGQPYTDPNPTAAKAFETKIAALKTEQDVLNLAFGLEQTAAQTYQGVGMKLSTPMLRQTAMTVGGVEARHMAILAHFLTPPMTVPAAASQPIDKAIDSSFYV